MLFHEIYGAYYKTLSEILTAAMDHPLGPPQIREIVMRGAFGESAMEIEAALLQERWPLLKKDGTVVLRHAPSMPMTELEQRWLKAISLDPRFRLFGVRFPELENVQPLFTPEDYRIFDCYADRDPYEDPGYIARFGVILDAIRNHQPIQVTARNKLGRLRNMVMLPEYLEYSEKDDKFRLIGSGNRHRDVVNLSRIESCRVKPGPFVTYEPEKPKGERTVTLEIRDVRNAMERVMLHFSHFRKEAERMDDRIYHLTLHYDPDDETEILIRILSFGPAVRVIEPEPFLELIRSRIKQQMSCELV